MNGGVSKKELDAESVATVEQGYANLRKHVQNMQHGLPVLVALNRFVQDTDAELQKVQELCEQDGTKAFVCDVWAKGGRGFGTCGRRCRSMRQENGIQAFV